MSRRIPIAAAALVRDGLVLMVHRHPRRRWYPDCWDLVGGHIEPGERPDQAVKRECFEELSIDVHDPRPMPMTVSDRSIDMHAFLITSWEGEPVNAAPDEHDDLGWFRPDEIAELKIADPAGLSDLVRAVSSATLLDGQRPIGERDQRHHPEVQRPTGRGSFRWQCR